jgi:hypothetical protein
VREEGLEKEAKGEEDQIRWTGQEAHSAERKEHPEVKGRGQRIPVPS